MKDKTSSMIKAVLFSLFFVMGTGLLIVSLIVLGTYLIGGKIVGGSVQTTIGIIVGMGLAGFTMFIASGVPMAIAIYSIFKDDKKRNREPE